MGDGTFKSGVSFIDHTYSKGGARNITLIVTDDDNASNSLTKTFTLINQPPVAIANCSIDNFTVNCTSSLSSDDDGIVTVLMQMRRYQVEEFAQ